MRILKVILAVAALVLAGVFLLGGVGYRDETEYRPAEENWADLKPTVNLQNTGTSTRLLGIFGRWDYGSPYTLFLDLTVDPTDVDSVIVRNLVVRADEEELARVDEVELRVQEVVVHQAGSQTTERIGSYMHPRPIDCEAAEVVVEGELAPASPSGEVEFRPFQRRFRRHRSEGFFWGI